MKSSVMSEKSTAQINANPQRKKRERLISGILAMLHASGGGCQSCTSCTR